MIVTVPPGVQPPPLKLRLPVNGTELALAVIVGVMARGETIMLTVFVFVLLNPIPEGLTTAANWYVPADENVTLIP